VGAAAAGGGAVGVHLVGIGWVIRCREEKMRVAEGDYKVDLADQSVQKRRRKSMEVRLSLSLSLSLSSILPFSSCRSRC
jgi:hypothetical protein